MFAAPPTTRHTAPPNPDAVAVDAVAVGAVAVRIVGELDVSTVPRIREGLNAALATRPDTVVVDLSACPFIDATAMTLLLETHRQACRSGVRFCLQGCSPRVLRLLSLTGLRGVFELAA